MAKRKKTIRKDARRSAKTPGSSTRRKKASAARRSKAEEPVVIYIHGIGPHEPPEQLKHLWDLATFGRSMGERTRLAYWSDILHPDDGAKVGRRTRAARAAEAPMDAAALLTEAQLDPEDERALEFVEGLAAALAAPGGAGAVQRGVRTKVLPLPPFLRRPIAERFLRWFIKDTAAYFFDDAVRRKIKARLLEQIPTSGEPFVLLSHSQGTIVSFEVLSERADRADVSLFVTMGSPLGIQEIQDLLIEDGYSLTVPDRVRAWYNFADRLDPVALDLTLDLEFEPRGTIQDRRVVNERTKDLQRFNPHSAIGYLSNQTVRSIVQPAVGVDPAGRFVVARDVAEGLVGIGLRQPVLIEALEPGYCALGEAEETRQRREGKQPDSHGELPGRIDGLAERVRAEVREGARQSGATAEAAAEAVRDARVQRLRKYVAAHLTPEEIERLARDPGEVNVYAIWRSAAKHKLIVRSDRAIKVDAARASYGADGKGIVWAVLDTGARWDHPHFAANHSITEVLDCTKDSEEPTPIAKPRDGDRDGHGTHVSGIIAGSYVDAQGREHLGMAPRAKLRVYQVLDDDGGGEDAWIIKAIDDIYRQNDSPTGIKIHGVNLSLGGPFDPTVYGCGFSPICKELRDLWRQGVLVCVAAGNEGQIRVLTGDGEFDLNTQVSVGDPANLEECIAVGSVHAEKPHLSGPSYFSSRGPTSDGRAKPDVVAPGERIESCNSEFRTTGRGANRRFVSLYRNDSGTSMACPHVSGLLAAFLSVRREYVGRPDEVKQILMEHCNDLGRDRYHQGAGLPNLMKMLLAT